MTTTRQALVLGGAGMLAPSVRTLVSDGWQVVMPSRRYHPLPADAPASQRPRRPQAPSASGAPALVREEPTGRALWIAASWNRPHELAVKARKAFTAPASLLISWLPEEYRVDVTEAIAPLLAKDAPVIEVYSGATILDGLPEPALPSHPHHQVALGYVKQGDRLRWPNAGEIAEAVHSVVEHALEGRAAAVHQVGEPNSWSRF